MTEAGRENASGKPRGMGCGNMALIGLAVIVGLYLWGDHLVEQEKAQRLVVAEAAPALELAADDFAAAWADNEVAAKQRFEARRLRVSGYVDRVVLNLSNKAVLHMRGKTGWQVTAHFRDGETGVATLARDQAITVLCTETDNLMAVPLLFECAIER